MKIDQLFQFVAVVKKGSINRAATDLYISQSSLSRSIKLLEQDLGAPLFMRTSQGVVLTPFGSEVYDVAERVCTDYERLASLHLPKSESVVKMRISSHSLTFVEHAFVETYKKYEVNNPQFSLVQTTIAQSTYDVKSGLSDVGISMCTSSSIHLTERLMKASNLEYSPICRLPMVAMVGVNHPLLKMVENVYLLVSCQSIPLLPAKEILRFRSFWPFYRVKNQRRTRFISVTKVLSIRFCMRLMRIL